MKEEAPNPDVIGNEITFPVPRKKPRMPVDEKKMIRLLLCGFFVIVGGVMGVRCSFFINAGYADGVVTGISKAARGYGYHPRVMFADQNDRITTFNGAQNLKLKTGDRVKVIYKKNNPVRAAIFTFFGFWFNSILVCQVTLFFWVGFLVVYYGDYP